MAHHWYEASLSIVPLCHSFGRSSCYSNRLQDFSATITRCYKDAWTSFWADFLYLFHPFLVIWLVFTLLSFTQSHYLVHGNFMAGKVRFLFNFFLIFVKFSSQTSQFYWCFVGTFGLYVSSPQEIQINNSSKSLKSIICQKYNKTMTSVLHFNQFLVLQIYQDPSQGKKYLQKPSLIDNWVKLALNLKFFL